METLFVGKDAVLEREDSTLVVSARGVKRRFPIHALGHVVLAGEARMTTALLVLTARAGVRTTVLDWHGNVAGTFEPANAPAAGIVRLAQARHALDERLRMEIARSIVLGTMRNLTANLSYRAYRGVAGVKPMLDAIKVLEAKVPSATRTDELMGLEGNARAWYFQAWPVIHEGLDFGARTRRPPNNPVNCLLSWLNGLCYSTMRHAIARTHLDSAISFLHSPNEARHSLALDLAELFKPAVADTLIIEFVLRDEISASWFHQEDGVCRLSEVGKTRTLEAWAAKVEAPGKGGASFKALMLDEALGLERHLLGIGKYSPWSRRI